MLSRITAIVAVALATSPFLVQAQQCAFIFDQARIRSDISTTKLRLKLIQDEIDLDARRKTFEDALLRQHFPLTCNEFVLAFWKRTKAIGIDDSVAYEYWTVQLPYMREGTTYNFPSDQTSAYFSAGGSAWVGHGRGYFGVMPSGNLTVRKVADGSAQVDVNLRLVGIFAAQRNVPTSEFSTQGTYFFD